MRCFYSENLELELPSGHPFPMEKFRISKDMLLEGGILRPEEIIEVRAADVHLLKRVHEPDYVRRIESGLLDRKEQTFWTVVAHLWAWTRRKIVCENA